ncbi:MAG: hypothetical protein AAF183_10030 [Pseudomonadota bacterium]
MRGVADRKRNLCQGVRVEPSIEQVVGEAPGLSHKERAEPSSGGKTFDPSRQRLSQ